MSEDELARVAETPTTGRRSRKTPQPPAESTGGTEGAAGALRH